MNSYYAVILSLFMVSCASNQISDKPFTVCGRSIAGYAVNGNVDFENFRNKNWKQSFFYEGETELTNSFYHIANDFIGLVKGAYGVDIESGNQKKHILININTFVVKKWNDSQYYVNYKIDGQEPASIGGFITNKDLDLNNVFDVAQCEMAFHFISNPSIRDYISM